MRRYRSLLAVVCALVALPAAAVAGEEIPQPPTVFHDIMNNHRLTIQARAALQREETLAPLKLVVVVKDGVAEVSGPVPSAEVARLAVRRLEAIDGVREVRKRFYAQATVEAPPMVPAKVPAGVPVVLNVPSPPRQPPVQTVAAKLPIVPFEGTRNTPVLGSLAAQTTPSKAELKPIPVVHVVVPRMPQKAVAPAQPVRPKTDEVVAMVRNSRPEFQDVRVERSGGYYVVSAGTGRATHASAFAQALRDRDVPVLYSSE